MDKRQARCCWGACREWRVQTLEERIWVLADPVAKLQFQFQRFRYRGLAKNTAHVKLVFTLVNLYWHREARALA